MEVDNFIQPIYNHETCESDCIVAKVDPNDEENAADRDTSSRKISKSPSRMRGQRKRRDVDPFTGLVTSTKRMKIAELAGEEDKGSPECSKDINSYLLQEFEENLFYSDSEDGSAEAKEYDSDSNDENYYKNEYPDEYEDDLPCTLNLENESTSDEDDFFDHYGANSKKETRYSDYFYEEQLDDVNNEIN